MEELRCLVCQGQSIADSDAELAGDMRALVRQRIAAGEKPEAVRAWLIERYGTWVSYRPPVEPVDLAAVGWRRSLLLLAGAWLAAQATGAEARMTGLLIARLLIAAARSALLWLLRLRGPLLTLAAAALAVRLRRLCAAGPARLAGSAAQRPTARAADAADRGAPCADAASSTAPTAGCDHGRSAGLARQDARTRSESCSRRSRASIRATTNCGSGSAMRWSTMRARSRPRPRFAFDARPKLAPGYPAPPFFLGLAMARSGDPRGGRRAVARDPRRRARRTPAGARWSRTALLLLERRRGAAARQAAQAGS